MGLDIYHKLFAYDLKIYDFFRNALYSSRLVCALARIVEWCSKWQLPLAREKCSVICLGTRPPSLSSSVSNFYSLLDQPIVICKLVKDLGVLVDDKLSFYNHISSIVHKAMIRSRLILKCFCSREPELLLKAYLTYVRPILEYCSAVWSPHLVYLIDKVEKVQRFFTKRIPGLWHLSYPDRLLSLGLRTLQDRRRVTDLAMCYRIVHGLLDTSLAFHFCGKANLRTRGHDLRLTLLPFNKDIVKFSFVNRSISAWNNLPSELVHASSVSAFIRGVYNLPLSTFYKL